MSKTIHMKHEYYDDTTRCNSKIGKNTSITKEPVDVTCPNCIEHFQKDNQRDEEQKKEHIAEMEKLVNLFCYIVGVEPKDGMVGRIKDKYQKLKEL